MKKIAIITVMFLMVCFTGKGQVQWNQSGDNYTTGRLGLGTSTPSADYDIDIVRNTTNAGLKAFNSSLTGRTVLLFGQGIGGKYGYIAHHGQSHNSGTGYSLTYRASSTTLTGSDVNGLGIISAQDIRFTAGGEDDTKQRMIINSVGQVGIGTASPVSLMTMNKIGTGAQTLELTIQSNHTNVARFGWNAGGYVDISSLYNNNHIVLTPTGTGNVGIGTASPQAKLAAVGSIYSNATRTNTVFSGTPQSDNANLIGSEGYWALRTSTNNSFNLDVYGSGTPFSAFTVLQNGYIGIGTTSPDAKLAVKGTVHTQEVKVDLTGAVAPDYVFEKDYNLQSLSEIESYIKQNKHLPEVPSAKEMEANGLNLKEMNLLLLKKVEELTLHLIEMKKEIQSQQKMINEQQIEINSLKKD